MYDFFKYKVINLIIFLRPYIYGLLIIPILYALGYFVRFNQKFLKFLYNTTKKFSFSILGMLVVYVFAYTIEPVIMPYLFGKITNQFYLATKLDVWRLLGISLGLYVVSCLFWTFAIPYALNIFSKIAPRVSTLVRKTTVEKVFNMPFSFFSQNDPGVIISKVEILAASTEPALELIFYDILPSLGAVFISIISIIKYNVYCFVVVFGWLFSHTILSIWEYKTMYKLTFKHTQILNTISGFLVNSLQNILLVVFFDLKSREIEKLEELQKQEQEVRREIISKQGFFYGIRSVNSIFFQAIIFNVVLLLLWQYEKISRQIFLTLFNMNIAFLHLVWRLSYKIPKLFRLIGSAEGAMDVFNRETEEKKYKLADLPEKNSGIMIKNLSYKFPEDKHPIISSFSINIPAKTKILICGHSGVGKTTLMQIFATLLDQYEGDIIFSGSNIKDIDTDKLRSYMSYVSAENLIFNASILYNITLDNHIHDLNKIKHSMSLAKIDHLVKNWPEDLLKSMDGLSSGEKQRVCIARAFYRKNNSLLLFADEPFSSLDNNNTEIIMNNLCEEFADSTIFCTDHKLMFLKRADIVIFMPRFGEMMIDNHKELYRYNSEYRSMCDHTQNFKIT